jgi:hypothetical protein
MIEKAFTGLAMKALTLWKTVTVDRSDLLERLISALQERDIDYCVVGGQAVNTYVEPLVSLDLDLAIAAKDLEKIEGLLASGFELQRFPHSINVSAKGSDLRVQFQTDPRYAAFPARAQVREVLGLVLPVARLEDVLDGKVWAALDSTQRPSKRQKDLADISRLLERFPGLRERVPQEIVGKLL